MIDEKKLIEEIDRLTEKYENNADDAKKKNNRGTEMIQLGKVLGFMEVKKIIKNQEKVSDWIPCSEEIPPKPKENPLLQERPLELYLVSVNGEDYPYIVFWNGKYFTDEFRNFDVVAWMPLPKPYKTKGD